MIDRRPALLTLAAMTLAMVLLAACSYDGPRPVVRAITISMDEYTIDVPAVVPAGLVGVRGLNDGDLTHQAVVAELPDGVTADDYAAQLLDDLGPSLTEADYRGGVQLVRAGREQTVTIALEPGRFIVWCALPGPEAGASHLTHGMWTDFTVEGDARDVSYAFDLLLSDGTIELIDWAYDVPETVRSGDVLKVVNTGTQVHEIGMASLADGATRDDVLAFLSGEAPADAAAPFTDLSGIGLLSPGERQTLPIDVPPGRYVFVCYVPDPDDGVAHFMKGMVSVITVV